MSWKLKDRKLLGYLLTQEHCRAWCGHFSIYGLRGGISRAWSIGPRNHKEASKEFSDPFMLPYIRATYLCHWYDRSVWIPTSILDWKRSSTIWNTLWTRQNSCPFLDQKVGIVELLWWRVLKCNKLSYRPRRVPRPVKGFHALYCARRQPPFGAGRPTNYEVFSLLFLLSWLLLS